jgi:uncharacterized membrane protein
MEVEKQELETVNRAIDEWVRTGVLEEDKAQELRQSVQLKKNERQQIAKYFFIVAISCTLLSFGAIFLDEKLLEKIKSYFALSNIFIAAIMALLASTWFWYINKRRYTTSQFAWEVYMVLGGLTYLSALVYFCKDIGFGASRNGFFIAAASLLFLIAQRFRSMMLWVGGILALLSWFGAFSTWMSTKNLFVGMNYPVRFTFFGIILTASTFALHKISGLRHFQRISYISALLTFLISFWAVSVFGNFGYLDEWAKVRQTYVIVYSLAFGITAAGVFYYGVKKQDDVTRDLGLVFLLLNLYSRYFEFFWDSMNKGIFFFILALSFWLIGRRIEKQKKDKENRQNEQLL